MTEASSEIRGGDYEQAGAASRRLKEQLKRIGAAPDIVRRAMIAAYEAEMNVVIHAHRGTMTAALDDTQVRVEVADEGPGIPDTELAMTEGYSTAGPRARECGFGAGMGLPNIRRSTDRFTLESTVGCGTRLRFTIYLKGAAAGADKPNSLHISPDRCTQCLRCLHACPTRALRVRGGEPKKLDYLCVDCAACMAACPAGALGVEPTADAGAGGVLVLPPAVAAQYAPAWSAADVVAAARAAGFASVIVTDGAEAAFRAAALQHAAGRTEGGPVLAAACPAVLALVEARFPSLIGHVAPWLAPLEAVREELSGRRATFVVLCPAQKTLLGLGGGPEKVDAMLPSQLESLIRPHLAAVPREPPAPGARETAGSDAAEPDADEARVLRVAGMAHVVRVLEEVENGDLADACVLELYACDGGCFGSPLLREDPFVARRRWRGLAAAPAAPATARAVPRRTPPTGRPGLRLDSRMSEAIRKLAEIDRLLGGLPGLDCGQCGCPTCAALAEDVVLGRATRDACRRTVEERS